ncbi:MAG: hypothetical protein IKM08_06790 [Clostridia bacterium]|nr:hypothetical protein [Clostridia bacterium]
MKKKTLALAGILLVLLVTFVALILTAGAEATACTESDCTGSYENGFCDTCGGYQPAALNTDGYYEIDNAGKLLWFAALVNSNSEELLVDKAVKVNAKLTADIDLTGHIWTPMGEYAFDGDDRLSSLGFGGIFDGCGHTVSGIDCTVTTNGTGVTDSPAAGFFGNIYNATIRNLVVKGSFKAVYDDISTNITSRAGGIVAYIDGANTKIENCGFVGSLYAKADNMIHVGGIVGLGNGFIKNCWSAATVEGECEDYPRLGAFIGMHDGTLQNCYYDSTLCSLHDYYDGDLSGVTGKTTAQFASGEVAYLLQGDREDLVFGQTLGTDSYPVLGGARLYCGYRTCTDAQKVYSNVDDVLAQRLHGAFGEDLKCTLCGSYDDPELQNGDYLITNPSELFWFAQHVNSGNSDAVAKIINDIDLGGREWTPIGMAENPFKGVIHGEVDGSVIRGLYVRATEDYAGFVGYMEDGSNTGLDLLTVYGEIVIEANDVECVGGIAGYSNATIRRCYSYVDIKQGDGITGPLCVGGIVGRLENRSGKETAEITRSAYFGAIKLPNGVGIGGVVGFAGEDAEIRDCANYGSIDAGADASNVGGIVGCAQNAMVYNCLNVGKITGTMSFGAIMGWCTGESGVASNNYYLDSSCDRGFGHDETAAGVAVAKTAAQLASGEVTWLLNEGSYGYWKQSIDDYNKPDAYPNFYSTNRIYYVTACDGVNQAYTNYLYGQLHISDGTVACKNCGAEVFVVLDGVPYFDGGDITNTGLDVETYDYTKMYFKAGEGYVLLTVEDIEVNMLGVSERYQKRSVLTFHNATVDLRGTEHNTLFSASNDLKVVFEGENNLYCNEKGGHGFDLSSTKSDVLAFAGKAGAILNIYGYGYQGDASHDAIDTGILVVESGSVNIIEVTDKLLMAVSAGSLLYVNEGASLSVMGSFLVVGMNMSESFEEEGLAPINCAGTLNAMSVDMELIEGETGYTYYISLNANGNVAYCGDFDIRKLGEYSTAYYTLTVPAGATMTVPEGATLDLHFYTNVGIDGDLIVLGTLICDHEGGRATCTAQAVCNVCKQSYGELERHIPAPDDSNCTTATPCVTCGAALDTPREAHVYGDWVKRDDETHQRACDCGATMFTGHTWNEGEITKQPTCTEQGEKTFVCTECDATVVRELWADENAHTDADENGECDGCGTDLEGGLSGGAIAGIVVGSTAVAALGGFALFWFVIKKKSFADLVAVFKKK